MDHKSLNEIGNHLEGMGIVTLEQLKARLQSTTMAQTNSVSRYIVLTYVQTVPERTLADAIKAGKYDYANPDINEKNFPSVGEAYDKKQMALFRFDSHISSEDAVAKMDEAGYRPATLMELLVIGENFPELQRQFPIVALGSSALVSRSRQVPVLGGDVGGRSLYLYCWGGAWGSGWGFLAVRK